MRTLKLISLIALLAAYAQGGAISRDSQTKHNHPADYIKKQQERHSDRQVKIHIISHTHDDVGWLHTVDEYFTSWSNDDRHGSVNLIISTVVDELIADPIKKFTYVEMKFFSMWWSQQTESKKEQVRQLVQEGRLEFVNAGWSMHDEACPHFEDMINNMMIGHQFLLREFGYKPRIGWHIDPFGHSSANPRLFAEMGFDAWFFGRLDRQDREKRYAEKSMEYIWRPFYSHLGNSTQIFTYAMYDLYCYPPEFAYDDRYTGNGDFPFVTNEELETFNADRMMDVFLERVYDLLDVYRGDHILVTMGCDFSFANAHLSFLQIDRLISYFNSHSQNVTLMYSTPGTYLDAIKQQNLTYPVNYYDMFPYSDDTYEYWSGFYTSRANSKKQIRDGLANIQASNKAFAMRVLDQHTTDAEIAEIVNASFGLLDVQGVNQHHDAVTGTAKQAVAEDYVNRIYQAIKKSNPVYASVMNELISYYSNIQSTSWTWCERFNGTYLDCPINDNQMKDHIVVVHNPTAYDQQYIRLKVSHGNYTIKVWNVSTYVFDEVADAAVICVNRIVESSENVTDCDMHIKSSINASAFTIFQIVYNSTANLKVTEVTGLLHMIASASESLNYTGSDANGVNFDLMKTTSGKTYKIAFDLRYYIGQQRGGFDVSSSGAYILSPQWDNQSSFQYAQLKDIKSFNGKFVQEIFMNFSNDDGTQNVCVKLRYYDQALVSEWEVYMAGIPMTPIDSPIGKEVTANWKSFEIKNNKTFYTDSNGLEMQKRILDYRPTYNYSSIENVSANYYPVNSAIAIVDETSKLQMTVLNDRTQGGTSLSEGNIELLQSRRCFFDDSRGVDEALNETDQYGNGISVPATYKLEFIERDQIISYQRNIQLFIDEPLQYFFSFNYTNTPSMKNNQLMKREGMKEVKLVEAPLVPAAFKYFLLPLERNKIQIRVENLGDRFDTDHWNLTTDNTTIIFPLDLLCQKLFDEANHQSTSVKLINITYVETSLSGNQEISEMRASKTNWNVESTQQEPSGRVFNSGSMIQDFNNIDLVQQRIRQFNVTFTANVTSSEFYQEEAIFLL